MNRRSFIKGLIALASAPAIGKYVNVFKTEGARKGIENVASQGVDFFNSVIKKVMDEGTLVNESDRIQTFKHPDRPDITVDVDVGSGSSSVYFDTDQGTKAGAELVKDIEVGPGYTELLENEEVYKMGGDEYYKDVQEEITGGITNLEKFLKGKKGFAAGGRVGFSGGGIFRGLKGIQLGKIQKDLINKYKNEGMEFIDAVTKGTDEGAKIVNEKKLNFLKNKFDDTNVYSDDYVKLIDEEIKLNDPEMFKDIRQFELNGRPELADKMRALRHPEWAAANFGEDYLTVLENRQVQGINRMMEDIDPNIKERSVLDDIDDMNRANIDDLFGRKKNAAGGRVGMFRGGVPKGLQAALRAIMSKYGDDAITTADKAPQPAKTTQEEIMDFNARNPNPNRQMTDEEITEFADEFGLDPSEEYYNWDGTLADARRLLKESEDETKYMYQQYKAGRLDPEPGSKSEGRMNLLRKRAEEMEATGDKRLLNPDEMNELSELEATYLNNVDEAYGVDTAMRKELNEMKKLGASKLSERLELKARYPGISDDLLDKILIDDNPQRKAELLATLDEAFAMMRKGKGPDEVLRIIKDMNRTKQADGGSIDGDVSLTVIKIPDISESGVESLFKRR